MKWKKSTLILLIIVDSYRGKISYRQGDWIIFKKSYELLKMIVIIRLGIGKQLTKRLQNL
jgi:hypothetical protein